MSKNIVLCSDGTGNSGGKANGTNVWRLFLALDHDPNGFPHQTAFYDDGVGTEEFKYAKLVGGAFGWGLSRNLIQLMGFLLRQYQPGKDGQPPDKVYLFGFSRGAFTIRVLANMIRLCGIPDCSSMSPDETNSCAAAALKAYKRREPAMPGGGPAIVDFRRKYGVTDGPVEIEFVGVWDTVEAIGLPFEEMKRGLCWLFPLRMRDGEDDLHENILHGRHALSVDDERLTFAPMLWDEEGRTTDGGKTVKQVWFPGMHANVGGGYPKDQLSLISLDWMMREANACGLRFYQTIWDEYQRDSDEDGQGYDSRSGLGCYYRYYPRHLQTLCDAKKTAVTLHESVLHRIVLGTDDYAPGSVPQTYGVEAWPVPGAGSPQEMNPVKRAEQLDLVQDVIWWGRAFYFLFISWTLTIVALCWRYRTSDPVVTITSWSWLSRLTYYLLDPILRLVQWATPSYLEPGVMAVRHHPLTSVIFALIFAGILFLNTKINNRYRDLVVKAWRMSLQCGAHKPPSNPKIARPTWWISLGRSIRCNAVALTAERLFYKVAPVLTVIGMVVAILWGVDRYLVPAFRLASERS